VLFGSGADWQADACVNGVNDSVAYQDGYRRAAILRIMFATQGEGRTFSFIQLSICIAITSSLF
jgi:hypothetical protein